MNTHIEIERRFLLNNQHWRTLASAPIEMSQGYLSVEKERTIRVRIIGEQAWLTIKGFISDLSRSEFEYEIPLKDAQYILQNLCPFRLTKWRYEITHQGYLFEIDEYFGENAPLITAEIELPSEDTIFEHPDWLGEEITFDGRYSNAYLSKHPYSTW